MFWATTYGALRHDQLRIEQRHIAVGKGKTLERELMRGAHDIDVDACRIAQRGRVDGLQAIEPLRHALRDGFLTRGRAIGQLRLQGGACAVVDAELRRTLGIVDQQLFGDGREQSLRGLVAGGRSAHGG